MAFLVVGLVFEPQLHVDVDVCPRHIDVHHVLVPIPGRSSEDSLQRIDVWHGREQLRCVECLGLLGN